MAKKPTKSARPKDIIPWVELGVKRQTTFESAFMENKARLYRLSVSCKNPKSVDFYMAESLRSYAESRGEVRGAFMAQIKNILALWLLTGRWDKLKWLSEYGVKHAPDGLSQPFSWETKRTCTFPKPKALRDHSTEKVEMAELILNFFVRLSGCSIDLIRFDSSEGPQQDATSLLVNGVLPRRMRSGMVPKCLPTKGYLEDCVIDQWAGDEEEIEGYRSLYRRTLAKLGLSGLPKRPRGLGDAGGFAG